MDLVPLSICLERFKQSGRLGVIDSHRRHVLRLRDANLNSLQSSIRDIVLQSVQQHRANIRGRGLQKVTEEIQIALGISQCSRCRNELENGRQSIHELQVLTVSTLSLIFAPSAHVTSYPGSCRA